jgi:hypothetical protein
MRRNGGSYPVTSGMCYENLIYTNSCLCLVDSGQSQNYSDLSISSLHSSEPHLQQQSSVTDLDETIKSTPKRLHVAREIVERYDEGVFDDGGGSQTEEDENNSVVIADSDEEDEIEHFDSNDGIDNPHQQQQLNDYNRKNGKNSSVDDQTVNLGTFSK